MTSLGPLTTQLDEEIKRLLRQHSLVIWLDKDGHYTSYIDQLCDRHQQGDFFAPVIPFRGSYLEMMLALEPYGNRELPDVLLIHMPGHTEETIRKTPLLELYRAGYRHRRALETLIRESALGQVTPDKLDAYLNETELSLTAAEAWLRQVLNRPQDDWNQYLDSLSLEWILEGLLGLHNTFKDRFSAPDNLTPLWAHLHRYTGIDSAFIEFYLQADLNTFAELSDTFLAWLMAVEYVHDLTRSPYTEALQPLTNLSKPLLKTCDRLIQYVRSRHPKLYASAASSVESRLYEELVQMKPEDLGKIDTFKQEEKTVLEQGALEALRTNQWNKALNWAKTRLNEGSFWIQHDRDRRLVWILVKAAATLGNTIQQVGHLLHNVQTLQEALESYTEQGYKVDQAHRHFEQQISKLLETSLPYFNELQSIAHQLRQSYYRWADQLADDFSKLCESEGFLPTAEFQQRHICERIIQPLAQRHAKVAYFLVDAFRFEMAVDLLQELQGSGITSTLKGCYAELPTITAVGMNVLAPVSQSGRLTLAGGQGFKGFKAGEYTVNNPETRRRAIGDRNVDHVSQGIRRTRLLTLSNVCDKTTKQLKASCGKADLVIVHSKEIDDAGEANVGIVTFERWIQQLKSAWNHLRSIGFSEFVFTADHGFLFPDPTRAPLVYGKKTDPSRRFVLSSEFRNEANTVTVSLNELGYEGQTGYLLFPRTTTLFDTGKSGSSFAHGGNSLQERVIPVLTVSHRYQPSLKLTTYQIEAQAKAKLLGCNRIQVKVRPIAEAQGILSFTGAKVIPVGIRIPDRDDIEIDIKDAPEAKVKNQQIEISVDQDWVEILFDLKGTQDERVKIEVYHPDITEQVKPKLLDTFFDVVGLPSEAPSPSNRDYVTDWQTSFEDKAIAGVFIHLERHNSVTETELIQMLGSARRVRKFTLDFEAHLQKVPFLVKVETTGTGKRYVKDIQS